MTIEDFEEMVAAATVVGLMSVLLEDSGSVKIIDLTPLAKLTNEVNERLAEIVRNKFGT